MKYIFDVAWFENTGRQALDLNPADYEPMPRGGWQNWTLKQNLVYINEMVEQGMEFTLVGDIEELREQAKNAGNGETRCAIGAIVLILYKTGFTVYRPDEDKPFHLLRFELESESAIPYEFEIDAIDSLSDAKTAGKFWSQGERKPEYNYMLDVIAKTGS